MESFYSEQDIIKNNLMELIILEENYGNLINEIRNINNPDILKNLNFDKFIELNILINELTEKVKNLDDKIIENEFVSFI